ncbi:uncharacterized protein LOC119228560 [Pungitius pungitius]|uniref:uncharacterized protein LOC119228560 n=1 Tax=Pungitius pungitius TaxID=134920 RepID=UPI002E1519E2
MPWSGAARKILLRSAERMKKAADRRRQPTPTYQPGQKVWLSTRNLPLHVASRKLAPRSLRVHPTFHVGKLKPAKESPMVPRAAAPPLPRMVDGGPVYPVKRLLAVRKRGRGRQYLVDWKGYGPEHRSWVRSSFIVDLDGRQELGLRAPATGYGVPGSGALAQLPDGPKNFRVSPGAVGRSASGSIKKCAVAVAGVYSVHKASGLLGNVCKDLKVPNTLVNRLKIRKVALQLQKSTSGVKGYSKADATNDDESSSLDDNDVEESHWSPCLEDEAASTGPDHWSPRLEDEAASTGPDHWSPRLEDEAASTGQDHWSPRLEDEAASTGPDHWSPRLEDEAANEESSQTLHGCDACFWTPRILLNAESDGRGFGQCNSPVLQPLQWRKRPKALPRPPTPYATEGDSRC